MGFPPPVGASCEKPSWCFPPRGYTHRFCLKKRRLTPDLRKKPLFIWGGTFWGKPRGQKTKVELFPPVAKYPSPPKFKGPRNFWETPKPAQMLKSPKNPFFGEKRLRNQPPCGFWGIWPNKPFTLTPKGTWENKLPNYPEQILKPQSPFFTRMS